MPAADKPAPHPSQKNPRDAATLVIVDRTEALPRILLGKRNAAQIFMPNKYVFPGGRVDPADRNVTVARDLDAIEAAKVMAAMRGKPHPWRARALALAAVRETFEEAGLVIGETAEAGAGPKPRPLPPTTTEPRHAWDAFVATGYRPALSHLSLFARAITPPGKSRRYDTRFFMIDARHVAHRVDQIDGELDRLDWFTFEEARRLDLPSITRAVVEDLADRLALDETRRRQAPVPFYFFRNGTFHREQLAVPLTAPGHEDAA